MEKFHRGDCVVTVATGAMAQQDADRAGLVESHAYAMLDIRDVLVKFIYNLSHPIVLVSSCTLRWRIGC